MNFFSRQAAREPRACLMTMAWQCLHEDRVRAYHVHWAGKCGGKTHMSSLWWFFLEYPVLSVGMKMLGLTLICSIWQWRCFHTILLVEGIVNLQLLGANLQGGNPWSKVKWFFPRKKHMCDIPLLKVLFSENHYRSPYVVKWLPMVVARRSCKIRLCASSMYWTGSWYHVVESGCNWSHMYTNC
jgi:hypothetical protein